MKEILGDRTGGGSEWTTRHAQINLVGTGEAVRGNGIQGVSVTAAGPVLSMQAFNLGEDGASGRAPFPIPVPADILSANRP